MGAGLVAGYGHLPSIVAVPGLKLESIFDPMGDAAQVAAKKFGAPTYCKHAEQFIDSGIDVVAITSPAPVHLENVKLAASRGLPILCEKPLGATAEEAHEIMRIAREANVPLWTGFCYRFSPVSKKIRELVRSRVVGEIKAMRLVYIWTCHGKYALGPDGQKIENPHRRGRMLEGGPMVDCGVHQIDLARWWTGREIVKSTASGAWCDMYEAPDHVWLHATHDNGCLTTVEISYSYGSTVQNLPYRFLYELIGTDGLIRYDRENKVFTHANSTEFVKHEFASEKGFQGMYETLERALRGDDEARADLPTGIDGQIATDLATAGTEQVMRERIG